MDSELRRRFLQQLDRDFVAIEWHKLGLKRWTWDVAGPQLWPKIREWWTRVDSTPVRWLDGDPELRGFVLAVAAARA